MKYQQKFVPGTMVLLVGIISGCGMGQPDPFPNMVPCTGVITLDGEPLDHGSITFAPLDNVNGQAAYGKIKHGHFQMSTTISAPGVIIGRYRVRVESFGPAPPVAPGTMAVDGPSLIPEKYRNEQTSGLEVDIQKGSPPIRVELARN